MDGIEAVGHVVLTTCFAMEYGGLRGGASTTRTCGPPRGVAVRARECSLPLGLGPPHGTYARFTSRWAWRTSSHAGCTAGRGTPTGRTSFSAFRSPRPCTPADEGSARSRGAERHDEPVSEEGLGGHWRHRPNRIVPSAQVLTSSVTDPTTRPSCVTVHLLLQRR
jgi:hypothetical protein